MKRVLFITNISGFLRPGNGGQLRSHYLLKELGRNNVVDIYCDKLPFDIESTPEWKTLRLNHSVAPKKARRMRKLSRLRGGSRFTQLMDQAFGMTRNHPPLLPANLLNKWCNEFVLKNPRYDVVMLDTLGYYPLHSWKAAGRKVWLNAHNVDSVLHPIDRRIGKLETTLTSIIDGVICCTHEDEKRFTSMNEMGLRTVCWGNGTHIPEKPTRYGAPQYASVLFVGSLNYEPNLEGLRWYLQEVHPILLEANAKYCFTVVGRNPAPLFLKELGSYEQVTVIPDATNLSELYYSHSICVVPLLSGSGSRLKIPEGLIHGCSIVSTSIGAEGYLNGNVTGLEIADTSEALANAIVLAFDRTACLRHEISEFALKRFTWSQVIQPAQIGLA